MLTLDDVLPLVGAPLDEARLARLLGTTGERSASEFDEDHPEDQRHYYTVAALGLEMILDGDVIDTIFFNPPGDAAGHRWTMRNGLDHRSSRQAVLAALGTPERSAPPDPPARTASASTASPSPASCSTSSTPTTARASS